MTSDSLTKKLDNNIIELYFPDPACMSDRKQLITLMTIVGPDYDVKSSNDDLLIAQWGNDFF